MLDLTRGTQSRLTFDEKTYLAPCWSGDGMFVIAAGGETRSAQNMELHRISVEGLVAPQVLTRGHFPTMLPGDRAVLYSSANAQGS